MDLEPPLPSMDLLPLLVPGAALRRRATSMPGEYARALSKPAYAGAHAARGGQEPQRPSLPEPVSRLLWESIRRLEGHDLPRSTLDALGRARLRRECRALVGDRWPVDSGGDAGVER